MTTRLACVAALLFSFGCSSSSPTPSEPVSQQPSPVTTEEEKPASAELEASPFAAKIPACVTECKQSRMAEAVSADQIATECQDSCAASCVAECTEARQMQATSPEAINEACMSECSQ